MNTGAARDVAVEEGGYANENRAREYMANGRNISAASPELKGAATMEAYVERQLKQKFPDDPMAVSRTMDTARNEIGQMIARGQDFPEPRIEDARQQDGTSRSTENKAQDTIDPTTGKAETEKAHEQNQEQSRGKNRER